jgi:HPr kinase/phosphorylase
MSHQPKAFKKEFITVDFMVEKLRSLVNVKVKALNKVDATSRKVSETHLHRPGLVLAGYIDLFTDQRVQVLGNTENRYLAHMSSQERRQAFKTLIDFPIPCIFLTESNKLDKSLVTMATEAGVPVYQTPLPSTDFMAVLRDFLNDQFALQQAVHGSLVAVCGIGMLIVGRSGIGKSEVALDLVERGHRLVADDVVIITKKEEQVLIGSGTDLVQHFMEIRGLGLVDVKSMFGVRAIRYQKRVEVVVSLEHWDIDEEYTRLGMVDETHTILGVELPKVKLPITPGKNVTVLCEVIAMNHLLRHYGYDPAEVFAKRLSERIREKDGHRAQRNTEYFEHDYE